MIQRDKLSAIEIHQNNSTPLIAGKEGWFTPAQVPVHSRLSD
jgi:hypothetical protein